MLVKIFFSRLLIAECAFYFSFNLKKGTLDDKNNCEFIYTSNSIFRQRLRCKFATTTESLPKIA